MLLFSRCGGFGGLRKKLELNRTKYVDANAHKKCLFLKAFEILPRKFVNNQVVSDF